jgi:alanine-glyoxylate transaminase/serine-glyoxylate transaminase/serine-pyruvate transaminase
MQAYEGRTGKYFATPAVQSIMALHASLKQLLADGMEKRFEKHQSVSKEFKKVITGWGLRQVKSYCLFAACFNSRGAGSRN